MSLKIGGIMALVSTIGTVYAGVETREADQVFNAWVSRKSASQQHIWGHVLLPVETETFVHKLKALAKKDKERYALFAALVKKKHTKPEEGDDFSNRSIHALYHELNEDIGAFVDRMQAKGWRSDELNVLEKKMPFQKVIDKNAQFAAILSDKRKHEAYKHQLFSLAQRMFFYLFDEGWKQTARFFSNPAQFPILRFFYSIIWQSLAGDGWKEWSPECINALKQQAKAGKTVRYIAGGCDIRALLDAGIFNIEVIDPMLPTQPKYYVDDWQWLVQGEIGDTIIFPSGLQLMRASYTENGGSFPAKDAKKQEIQIPISTITWEVRNPQGEVCGKVVFVRRFCSQEDFAYDKKCALLLSFNELSFITCADSDNWGINPAELNKKTEVYIKQLYKPVSARIMRNMHKADGQEFSFIRLGSCVK
ncbi:hypothetical protein FJ365_01295 [Candidatus Dependentiae bacterium]|nr:hypothetical protein [Candidatus Dependentiae bacterium]